MKRIDVSLGEPKLNSSNPYFTAYSQLKTELFILEELNKQLPKSVKQIMNKRKKDLNEKITNLDRKSKAHLRADIEKIVDFVNKAIKMPKSKKRVKRASLSGAAGEFFWDFICTFIFSTRFNMFIRDMSLVYLVAEFESFLRDVLEISFKKEPEILASSKRAITFEELVKFKEITDAKQQITEKEILSVTNQDIEDIDKYFEQKFSVKLSQFANWEKFKERFYRRNIIIHNSGMTNRLYRLKTGYKGKDRRMTVSQDYLKESIKLFENMGLSIAEQFTNRFK